MSRTLRFAIPLVLITLLVASPLDAASPPMDLPPAPAASSVGDVVVQPDASGVTLTLTVPSYQIEEVTRDGQAYQHLVVDAEHWTMIGAAGAPQVPGRGLLLAVPPTGNVSLEVLDAPMHDLAGNFRLEPGATSSLAREPTAEDAALQKTWQADPAAYGRDAWTPAAVAEIGQEGWLRGYRFVRLALHPFQFNPAAGTLRVAPELRVRLNFSQVPAGAALPANDPLYASVFRATFANYDQAAAWQDRGQALPLPGAAAQRGESTEPWVKVTVDADGLYRLGYGDLLAAGVPAATLDSLNPRTFRLLDEGAEQNVFVLGQGDGSFDANDYILFYGWRNSAPLSSDNNIYWLTWGGANGLRMIRPNAAPGSAPFANTLLTTAHAEENNEYKQQRPFVAWRAPVLYDQWYWQQVVVSKTVTLPGLAVDTTSSVNPSLRVWMAGDDEVASDYVVSTEINGQPVSDLAWTDTQVLTGTFSLPAGLLVDGDNDVWLAPQNVQGQNNLDYTVWLDWVELTYPYDGTYLPGAIFNNPDGGTWRYRITGSPSATPWILDVKVPGQPRLLANVAAAATGGTYTLTWELTTGPANRFVVVPDDQVRQPAAVELFEDPGLLDPAQQVDYLMIAYPDLIPAVQPLADAHANADGLSVKIVDVFDVYDTFSDGSVSAEAIRDYLDYAYHNYQWPAPSVVLLVGDGTVDFRGYQYQIYGNANLVPPYMGGFDAWGGASIADTAYTWLQGDDVLGEMLISRLPVNSPAETQVVVDKILNYAQDFPPDRILDTLWVADNPDEDQPIYGTQFHMASDETLALLLPEFQADRIYFCDPDVNDCPPDPWYHTDLLETRAAIVDGINQGHLFLHFSGHGSYTTWAHEKIFRSYWVDQLNNGAALPFLLVSSCTNGYFADPRYNAMDEVLLRTADRGTIGGFTGATFDTLPSQTVITKHFMDAVMQDRITQVGPAAAVARSLTYGDLAYPESERTVIGHALSGDPLLTLLAPDTCADGDLDCDGDVDILDVQQVAAAWGSVAWGQGYNPRADLVRDGHIDVRDIMMVAGLWRMPQP